MNRIQFQPGLSLSAFLRDYGDEARCEAAQIKARWPNGFAFDRCQCTRHSPTHNWTGSINRTPRIGGGGM